MSSQMKQSSAGQNGPFDTLLGANEIKILIPEFNPSKFRDLYANEWINDVETLGRIHKWDNPRLLLYATMRLGGIARVWYEYSLEGITCWDDFKWDLLSNFPRTVEAADVHAKLAKRTRQPDEAIEEFVHNTVKLARKIQLDDCEIVEYLIQGIDQPKHQMVLSSLGICSPSEFLQHMQLLEDDSNGAVSSRHSKEVSPRLKDHQMSTRRQEIQEYFDGGESLKQRDRMITTDEDSFDQRPSRPFRPRDFQDPEDWRPGRSSYPFMHNPGSFADSFPFNQIQSFGPYDERFFPSYDPCDGRPLASTSDPYNCRLLPPSHNQGSFSGSAPDPITYSGASFQGRSLPSSFQRRSSPSADHRSLPPASFQRRSSPPVSFQRRSSPPASFQRRSSPSSHQLNPQASKENSDNPRMKRPHSPDKKNPIESSDKKEAGPKGKKKKLKKCFSCMSTDHLIVDCPKKTGKKDPEEKQHQASKEIIQSHQQATSSSTSNIPDKEKPKEDVGLKKENTKILKEPENRMQQYADMIAKQELLARGKHGLDIYRQKMERSCIYRKSLMEG
uniref:Retrotransposon gag domain-containing protein n=1 Tax=Lutzomyia longipalpis TaxID=7200 RepID=A0A1B0CR36_LUTLO